MVEPAPGTPAVVTDVVGPVCETGDYLALARALPALHAGDLISVMTAGAYGAVLASEYNSRLLVPEVLVAGNRCGVTRPRPSYDDMLAGSGCPTGSNPLDRPPAVTSYCHCYEHLAVHAARIERSLQRMLTVASAVVDRG